MGLTMTERGSRESHEAGTLSGHSARSIFYNDYTSAIIIVVICALVYTFSTWIEKVPVALAQGIQPASFPQGVLVAILALVLLLLYESRRIPFDVPEPVPGLAYKTIAGMIIALAISTWFDFFIGIIAFVAVSVQMWGLKRPYVAVAYAIALTGVLILLFSTLLQVRFPKGPFTNLLG
jgi:hypothetical protein